MKRSLWNKVRQGLLPLMCAGAALNAGAQNPVAPAEATVTSGNARFTVLTPEMIRIEYSDKGIFEDRATFTVQNREMESVPQFEKSEDKDYLYISTSKLNLKYRKGTNPKTLPASANNLNITMDNNGQQVTWYPGKPDPLNLKGTCRTLDGCNGDNKRSELENGLISRSGWAVIDDSWTAARPDGSRSFALVPDQEVGYDWWAERNDPYALDLYFMGYGNEYKKAIGDFTKIAGKIPLPPSYVFGYWYSRYSSYSADDYRQIMKDIEDNEIPADVMILDMDWHWNGKETSGSKDIGGWTGWSWNTNLIPDPKGLLKEIHDKNFKISLNLHPADGINSHESPEYFNQMKADLGGKYGSDGDNIAWNLDFPDFTKSFFKNIIRDHESEGVDFWWLDWQQHLTSPYTSGLGQTFWCNHVFYNDMVKNRPGRRPVIFHRWGGLGSHRYQIGFSGDALINFPTLAFEPYFTATASNVGYAYWGHDLGGHAFTDESIVNDPELMLRWIQFGVFTPIFRSHATDDSRIERRIWKFPNFPKLRDAVRLRYTLFPYIYTMARETYDTGIGMCRPLYYECPDNEEAYRYEGEYFFGNDILVAPITEPSEDGICAKEIWFPQGKWWSASTGELIDGPCVTTINFKDDQIPYFFRQGSVVPLNPATVMNVTEPYNKLILNVVAGADGSGRLYEDDGDNPDYADSYAMTEFNHTSSGKTETYTILPRKLKGIPAAASAKNAPRVNSRTWTLNVLNAIAPESVTVNGVQATAGTYRFNNESKTLSIDIPETSCSEKVEVAVNYKDVINGISETVHRPLSISYDKKNDTLVADLGTTRNNVNIAIFDLAGMECLNKNYSGVSYLSENLGRLDKAMYICRVLADKELMTNKIYK